MLKNYLSVLAVIVLVSCTAVEAKRVVKTLPAKFCGNNQKSCADLNNPCTCYCSQKCGPREKVRAGAEKDMPVFVENDKNGKFCYCQQADLNEFETNCKKGAKRSKHIVRTSKAY